MTLLKQSTAATVVLGPFVDLTDGVTAETGLTIAQADIRLSKNGAAFAQTNNATGATHMENGYYSVPLDTTDTGTLGRLTVAVSESGALPAFREYMVIPANDYDSLVLGTDNLEVDATQVEGADATDTINAEVDTAISDAALATAANLATVDTVVDAILVDTGTTIPTQISALNDFDPAADAVIVGTIQAGVVDAVALAADAAEEVADTLLNRNINQGGNGGRTVEEALAVLRNKVSVASGTITVFDIDDTATLWSGSVVTTAGNPVTEVDPT